MAGVCKPITVVVKTAGTTIAPALKVIEAIKKDHPNAIISVEVDVRG